MRNRSCEQLALLACLFLPWVAGAAEQPFLAPKPKSLSAHANADGEPLRKGPAGALSTGGAAALRPFAPGEVLFTDRGYTLAESGFLRHTHELREQHAWPDDF
jgi:hypothetical protein